MRETPVEARQERDALPGLREDDICEYKVGPESVTEPRRMGFFRRIGAGDGDSGESSAIGP